jgi:uncharacterized membrane protein
MTEKQHAQDNGQKSTSKSQDITHNLDFEGVGVRMLIGVIGLVFTIYSLFEIIYMDAEPGKVFIGFFMMSVGFIQARQKYCVMVSLRDILLNRDGELLFQRLYRITKIVGLSFIISLLLTGLTYIIF